MPLWLYPDDVIKHFSFGREFLDKLPVPFVNSAVLHFNRSLVTVVDDAFSFIDFTIKNFSMGLLEQLFVPSWW